MAKFSLQVESDHSTVKQGADALDDFAKSADNAGTAAEKFNQTAGKKGSSGRTPAGEIANDAKKGTTELTGFAKRLDGLGVSAGYASVGLTNAGNQLSDFVVQIASGQSAFTALIQQGPQLATSFGSFSGTLRVLASFINPVTIGLTALAAAGAYAGYSIYKEHARFEDFNDTLKQTGYQSGLTVTQLQGLSTELVKNAKISQDTADAAVKAAVQQGGSYIQIAKNAQLAAEAQDVLGRDAQDTAKWLKAAYSDPVDALIRLSDELGGVTVEQYQHIAALQEAGRTQEAAAELTGIYKSRLDEIAASSTQVAKQEGDTWTQIKTGIDDAVSSLALYLKQRDDAAKNPLNGASNNYDAVMQPLKTAAMSDSEKELNRQREEQAKLQATRTKDQQVLSQRAADAEKANAQEQIALLRDADAWATRTMTHRQQLEQQLQQVQQKRNQANEADVASAVTQYDKSIAAIKAQIKQQDELDARRNKPKAQKQEAGAAAAINSEAQANARLLDYQARLADVRQGNTKLIQEEAAALHNKNLIAMLETTQAKGLLNVQQKNQLEALKANQVSLDQVATIGRQIEQQKELNRLNEKHNQVMQSAADEMATLGMSTKEANRYLDEQAQIRERIAQNPLTDAGAITAQVQQEAATKAAADAAKSADWMGGLKTGLADWAEAASNYSEIARTAITSAMDSGVQAIADFVVTGKNSFKDFATSVLKMISEIITKLLLMKAINAASSALGFGDLTKSANGNVMTGAGLSAFSGQIVDRPTFFNFDTLHKFASGAGLMGEAGPEAVLPLRRGADGKLGVVASGAGGGASGAPQIGIYVDVKNGQASASSTSDGSKLGDAWAQVARDIANQTIEKALEPGGRIFMANQG